jgi:hypothetical protein
MDGIKDGSLTDLSALADLDDGPFSEVRVYDKIISLFRYLV